MTRSNRPSFLLTASERKELDNVIDTTDIMRHYRNILRGSSTWEGLPDDMPTGYIESTALWYAGGFALKRVKGMGIGGFPANPVTVDIYGQPYTWLPSVINGVSAYKKTDTAIYTESDTPVLWIGTPLRDQIKPYVQLMERTLKTLGQNLTALGHPVIISGNPSGQAGDNIGALLLKSDLDDGAMYIPTVTGLNGALEALDLHATDNTQNLISTLSACDARILEILNTSNGIEKSSGITTEETETGSMPLEYAQGGYDELCDVWAEKVNAKLGLNIKHKRREIEIPEPAPETSDNGDDDDGDDDDS